MATATKTKKFKIAKLDVARAGSDYLRTKWSISVRGVEFVKGETYELVRSDGSSFPVKALRKESIGWLLVEM